MPNKHILIASLILISAFIGSIILKPNYQSIDEPVQIAKIIPDSFNDWKETSSNQLKVGVYTDERGNAAGLGPYDQVVNKEFMNSKGQKVLLTVAWVQSQKQEVKVHRPELCYPAQGFSITNLKEKSFNVKSLTGQPVVGKQMFAANGSYAEAVSYWIRTGDIYTTNPWKVRFYLFKQGLKGKILDGVLVRVSTPAISGVANQDLYLINEAFIVDLVNSIEDKTHLRYLIN